MFTHCGGKAKIPVIVKALTAVGVPTAVIADFDVLNDTQPLKAIVEASQGDWKQIESNWRTVKNTIDSKKAAISITQLKSSLIELADTIADQASVAKVSKEIGERFKQASPWDMAKSAGSSSIPNGDPTLAYTELISKLKTIGIFVVEVGELEGFVRSAAGHGPKWVNNALEKDIVKDAEFDNVKKFIAQIINIPEQKHVTPQTSIVSNLEGAQDANNGVVRKLWMANIATMRSSTLATLMVAVAFVLDFVQGRVEPLYPKDSSLASAIYMHMIILEICYIIYLGKQWAKLVLVSFFVLEIITTVYSFNVLLKHPLVLLSYSISLSLQGFALWLLFRKKTISPLLV